MNTQQINKIIAEEQNNLELLDYCNDLNAMHKVEISLDANRQFTYWIKLAAMQSDARFAIFATAAQRAEAYLKTIGKWNETFVS